MDEALGARGGGLIWLLLGTPGRRPSSLQLSIGCMLVLSLLGITAEWARVVEQFCAGLRVGLRERDGWFPAVDLARRMVIERHGSPTG